MTENIYNLEIFKWINPDVIEYIIENCSKRKYLAFEKIIEEWEQSNWEWYILKSGKVSVNINWQKIAELNSWDIFWEIALLNEEIRTATVIALSDIEVIVLSFDDLMKMIDNDPNKINKTIIDRIEKNINLNL